jgi:sterol desaturase/sphingolipid hydroxylase (fatty acid hydroxylase superfamily)
VAILITAFLLYILPIVGRAAWPYYLAINNDHGFRETIVVIIWLQTVFILTNSTYFLIYYLEWDFFERYKHNPDPWPWQQDKAAWDIQLRKTLKGIYFNAFFVSYPMYFLLAWLAGGESQHTEDMESLPDSLLILLSLTFLTIVETMGTSLTHMIMHHPRLYSIVHKRHHEYTNTVSLTTEYITPWELVFGTFLPIVVGPAILGKHLHLYTLLLFYALRTLESSD